MQNFQYQFINVINKTGIITAQATKPQFKGSSKKRVGIEATIAKGITNINI